MNNKSNIDKILLLNFDEKGQTFGSLKITNFPEIFENIIDSDPYLIIVTSQNSLSRTDNHFQHYFGEELLKNKNWKRLSKIDATKPIHSSSISSTFSKMFKNPDPYNVRTRIYYNTANVCVNFKDDTLSKKSCFANQKSSYNNYNSNSKETGGQCQNYMQNIMIDKYYMKRYTHEDEKYSKTGDGIITIGLIFKIKENEDKYSNNYKLIISNRRRHNTINNNLSPIQIKQMKENDKSSIYIVSATDSVFYDGITKANNNDFKITVMNLNYKCKINNNTGKMFCFNYNSKISNKNIYNKSITKKNNKDEPIKSIYK